MKIVALRLFNVRRFAARGIAIENIGDGVNVLSAPNEAGKSTSFEALHALFFQPHRSTAGEVKGLRPYSGGNPVVEADVTNAGGRYRIRKQFLGGPALARVTDLQTGKLIRQGDEAEAFIADLVQEGASGPAGLLWVRQGMTGLEKRGGKADEVERQARAGLLESVQGEVEAVTGGRRMAEIMDKVGEDLGKLVTSTGRPKAGGLYASALDEHVRLEAEVSMLKGKVDRLRGALDGRAMAERRLAELEAPEAAAARRAAIAKAQVAMDAAKLQVQVLRAAEARLDAAELQHGIAARTLETYRYNLKQIAALDGEMTRANRRRGEALAQREAVDAVIAEADRAIADATGDDETARLHMTQIEAAKRARAARDSLDELVQRLEEGLALRADIETAQATQALLVIPSDAVEELAALELDIVRLHAVRAAGQPSVRMHYDADEGDAVAIGGVVLRQGEERRFEGHAELSVRGVGRIALSAGSDQGDAQDAGEAEHRRQILLKSIGVETLGAARARQTAAAQGEAALRGLIGKLAGLVPEGLAKLQEEVAARREASVEIDDAPFAESDVRAALEAAEARLKAARVSLREAGPARRNADAAFTEAEVEIARIAMAREQAEAVLGPGPERAARERQAEDEASRTDAALTAHRRNMADQRASSIDLESAEASWRRAQSADSAAATEIGRLQTSIAELTGEIRSSADSAVEENWREACDALEAAARRVEGFEREVEVLSALGAALATSRGEARDVYLQPVMAELKPLLRLLFDNAEIEFDEKTLLPQSIVRNGLEEEVDRLSGGMREQLSVLTRLAFARLLAKNGRPAPIILDDALIYSDDDRIERMFDALHRQAAAQQIIVFSCRQRAFAQLGGNPLQMTAWTPS